MRVIIQRVAESSVKSKNINNNIGKGFIILVAARKGDTQQDADYLANKIVNLRIMADEKKT